MSLRVLQFRRLERQRLSPPELTLQHQPDHFDGLPGKSSHFRSIGRVFLEHAG